LLIPYATRDGAEAKWFKAGWRARCAGKDYYDDCPAGGDDKPICFHPNSSEHFMIWLWWSRGWRTCDWLKKGHTIHVVNERYGPWLFRKNPDVVERRKARHV